MVRGIDTCARIAVVSPDPAQLRVLFEDGEGDASPLEIDPGA
jgi:hypothetical protein